jgi:hypothetical protein
MPVLPQEGTTHVALRLDFSGNRGIDLDCDEHPPRRPRRHWLAADRCRALRSSRCRAPRLWTRFDRRHAYYSVNGDQVSRQFTLPQYMALPEAARFKLLDEVSVGRWVARTTDAYARRVFVDFESPGGKWIYRLRKWYLNFLRND